MANVPSQPHILNSVILKVERAHEQLQGLSVTVKKFMESEPYRIEPQINPDATAFFQVIRVQKECPLIWSVLIGEIIHDLRSALDHIRHQLVIHETGIEPPLTDKKGQFPIFLSESGFKDRGLPTMLNGVGVKAKALIESEQPFRTGEGAASPLWRLSELSNWDKHRTIPLTGGAAKTISSAIESREDLLSLGIREDGPFKDNTELAWANYRPDIRSAADRRKEVKMESEFSLYICFDKPVSVHGVEVLSGITAIGRRVYKIAERVDREILNG